MTKPVPPYVQAGAPMTPGEAAKKKAEQTLAEPPTCQQEDLIEHINWNAVAQAAIDAFKRSEEMAEMLNEASRAGAEAACANDPLRKIVTQLVEDTRLINDGYFMSSLNAALASAETKKEEKA